MARYYGCWMRAGKVKSLTPAVQKQDKKKKKTGRARMRQRAAKVAINEDSFTFAGPNAQNVVRPAEQYQGQNGPAKIEFGEELQRNKNKWYQTHHKKERKQDREIRYERANRAAILAELVLDDDDESVVKTSPKRLIAQSA